MYEYVTPTMYLAISHLTLPKHQEEGTITSSTVQMKLKHREFYKNLPRSHIWQVAEQRPGTTTPELGLWNTVPDYPL